MGSTNYGFQTVRYSYQLEARSSFFNETLHNVIPPGIYEGGLLSKNPLFTNRCSVSPMTVFIYDPLLDEPNDKRPLGVRVQTKASIDLNLSLSPITGTPLTPTQQYPYSCLSFTWNNVTENYMDIFSADQDMIDANPDWLVIGRAYFIDIESVLYVQETFDYSRRTLASLTINEAKKNNLRVLPIDDTPKRVYVNPGKYVLNNTFVDFPGGTSEELPNTPVAESRVDLIFLDSAGTVGYLEGVPGVVPEIPRYPKTGAVVAEIHRGLNKTIVQGNDIVQVEFDRYVTNDLFWGVVEGAVNGLDIPIGADVTKTIIGGTDVNIPKATKIPDALQSIIDSYFDLKAVSNDSVKDRHIDWGVGVNQVNADLLPLGTAITLPTGATNAGTTTVRTALQNTIDNMPSKYLATANLNTAIQAIDGTGSGIDADLLDGAHKSTDGTLASNGNALIPTEYAVKTYADTVIRKVGFPTTVIRTTSGTWTVPAGITKIKVILLGGGGSGGAGADDNDDNGYNGITGGTTEFYGTVFANHCFALGGLGGQGGRKTGEGGIGGQLQERDWANLALNTWLNYQRGVTSLGITGNNGLEAGTYGPTTGNGGNGGAIQRIPLLIHLAEALGHSNFGYPGIGGSGGGGTGLDSVIPPNWYGQGGGGGEGGWPGGGGGGGATGSVTVALLTVSAGQVYNVIIGAGGNYTFPRDDDGGRATSGYQGIIVIQY